MSPSNWRINLLLAVSVVLTLIVALLMAQLDGLQIQLRPTAVPIANVPFGNATNTPLPAIPLQSATPNPTEIVSNEAVAETAVSLFPSCEQTPSDWVAYQVGLNDTLRSLSIVYNVSESYIAQANCLQMTTLLSGMMIYLPTRPVPQQPTVTCGPPAYWVLYQVQPGDTIFALASSRGVRVYDVLVANCSFESSYLQAGMLIYLPPVVIFPTTIPTLFMTPTSTATLLATETAVSTATATMGATITATLPATQTPTGTLTPVSTGTVVATDTPIGTVTPTIVVTGTETPLSTPMTTVTATPMLTPTAFPSMTPLPTETAVSTATMLPTQLPTALPSMTPMPSP